MGGFLVLYGLMIGWQALFENHSVQTAINSVLLILFGLISIYAGSHDQFVSERLKSDSVSRSQ